MFLFLQSNNRCHGIKWMENTCKRSPSLNRSSFQGISSFNTDSLNRTSKKKAKDIISCVHKILLINVKNYIENGIYYFSVVEQSVFSFECFIVGFQGEGTILNVCRISLRVKNVGKLSLSSYPFFL